MLLLSIYLILDNGYIHHLGNLLSFQKSDTQHNQWYLFCAMKLGYPHCTTPQERINTIIINFNSYLLNRLEKIYEIT